VQQCDAQLQAFWQRSVRLAQVVLLLGALILYLAVPDNGRALALGLLLGGTASILRYKLSLRALLSGQAATMVRTRMLNFALSGIALALAFWQRETFSLWSTAAGLIVMNGSILIVAARSQKQTSDNNTKS
jgi:hypothetical protein